MLDLVKDNYMRPHGHGDQFRVEIDKLPRPTKNYFQESVLAAEEIYSLKDGKLFVMYSGGIDSEYALSVFVHLKMDVTPVIIRLQPGYNDHDTEYAFKFCAAQGLIPVVIDVDLQQLVSSGTHLTIAKRIKSSVYEYIATAYAMTGLDGTVLMGDGEPTLSVRDGVWYFDIAEHEFAVANYMRMIGMPGTPFFNCYRPQMLAAFMLDPYMVILGNGLVVGHTTSHEGKIDVYNRHSPFVLQSRPKYTGYEKARLAPEIKNQPQWGEMLAHGKQYNGSVAFEYKKFVTEYIGC